MQAVTVRTAHRHARHRRSAWLGLALCSTTFAIFELVKHGVPVWLVVLFALGPDLSFLAGAGQASEPGKLAARAVPVYNLVHRPAWPVALIAAAAFDLLPLWCFVAGLAWLAHISFDRASGFGLRTKDGWQRG